MEIRRRVWYSIGILDMQAAFDGGSHSVIASNGVLGCPPLNVNDSLISPTSSQPICIEKPGLTDMSFNCMMHEALICWRRLTHVPTDPEGQPVKMRQDWSIRSKTVRDWEQRIHEKYLKYCDSTQPFHIFMKFVGQDMTMTMRLLERRPMHRLFSAGPPPVDDFNVLELATDVVERSLLKFTDPSLVPWSWFAWIKWYALSIIIAELCGHGNGPLIDRAWKVAEEAFPKFADLVIDDVLWRSVAKLMQKARCTRVSRGSTLPILTQAASPCMKIDSGRPNKENIQIEGDEWTSNGGVQARDHKPEPPTETGQARPQLVPLDVSHSESETPVDESEYMSWINWELFVQDVGNYSEQTTLDTAFGGSYSTT